MSEFDAVSFLEYWGFERIKIQDEENVMASCFQKERHSNNDRKRSFGILRKDKWNPILRQWIPAGTANCYVCGGWSLERLTAELFRRKARELGKTDFIFTEYDAMKWLESKGWLPEPPSVEEVQQRIKQIEERPAVIPETIYPLSILEPYLQQLHRRALKRGNTDNAISVETARDWLLGYDPITRRIIIPCFNEHGSLIGVVSRAVDEDNIIRYGVGTVNPEWQEAMVRNVKFDGEKMLFVFDKRNYVFGEHRWSPSYDKILVVESPLDVVYAYGLELDKKFEMNIGAVYGSKVTRAQLNKILRHRKVIEALDNDDGGKEGREKFIKDLLGKVQIFQFDHFGKKDLGECTPDELLRMDERITGYTSRMFSHLKEMI